MNLYLDRYFNIGNVKFYVHTPYIRLAKLNSGFGFETTFSWDFIPKSKRNKKIKWYVFDLHILGFGVMVEYERK